MLADDGVAVFAEAAAFRRISEEFCQGGGQRSGIVGCDESAAEAVHDEVGQRADARGDDGKPVMKSFHDDDAERFDAGGKAEDGRPGHLALHFVSRDTSEYLHVWVSHSRVAANDNESGRGFFGRDDLKGFEKRWTSLSFPIQPDEQNRFVGIVVVFEGYLGRVDVASRTDATHLISVDSILLDQRLAHVFAHHKDVAGVPVDILLEVDPLVGK